VLGEEQRISGRAKGQGLLSRSRFGALMRLAKSGRLCSTSIQRCFVLSNPRATKNYTAPRLSGSRTFRTRTEHPSKIPRSHPRELRFLQSTPSRAFFSAHSESPTYPHRGKAQTLDECGRAGCFTQPSYDIRVGENAADSQKP
jgi:hypothetical protein